MNVYLHYNQEVKVLSYHRYIVHDTGCQLLIFKKKVLFKRFQFLKKKREGFIMWKKGVFLHLHFQILELKKGFALKKKGVLFIANFLHSFRLARSLGLPKIRGSPGQPLAHFSACTRWCTIPSPDRRHTVEQRGLPN